jgi:hypothetical protein
MEFERKGGAWVPDEASENQTRRENLIGNDLG